MPTRREFSQMSLAAGLSSLLPVAAARPPRILLRSSWQTVNIGDIAHTPGVLRLLEQYLPQCEVSLWPSSVKDGVDALLLKRFPKLTIVQGAEAVKAAMQSHDFLLHGSGPSLVAEKDVVRWRQETGKPYGVYGITVTSLKESTVEALNGAKFAFFRDSVSLQHAQDKGCTCPVMGFAPDGAFATDLRDDDAATAFLAAHGLTEGRFLCCINRLRNTPYWRIKPNTAFDEAKNARNEALKEHDSGPLREAIQAVLRETDLKILLCPEDATQMLVNKEQLYDRLPAEARERVVWRENYWLTGEAVSTYVRSAGLFGHEMHSPIMAVGHGIPAIVCRWAEQTSKGYMWRDIGLGDWLFDFDRDEDLPRLAPAVLAMAKDPAAAKAKAATARAVVERRQRETMAVLAEVLGTDLAG